MTKHRCHAAQCDNPCPPKHLMCASCWRLVPATIQARVYASFRRRGAVTDARAAPWWRAQADAIEANALARGVDARREVARDRAFADKLESDR